MNIIIILLVIILLIVIIYNITSKYNNVFEYMSTNKINPKSRKILIIYTGGTIGMVETSKGNKPKPGFFESKIKSLLNNKNKLISPYIIKEYKPLLDSSNMSFKDWNKILLDIRDNYDKYDSFIVVHGTDTMAYTAAALSFGLQNLGKPVIITGSQIPMQKLKNDGGLNMISSLIIASNYNIPEVLLVFDNNIFRGNRAHKTSSTKLNAFDSPNFEPIGSFGYSELPVWREGVFLKPPSGKFSIQQYSPEIQVYNMFLTPGIGFENIKKIIESNHSIKGVIIHTYGIGDAPTSNQDFIAAMTILKEKKILVAQVSQTIEGHIDTGDYETGKELLNYNIMTSNDMTIECAYCKLLYLLNTYNSYKDATKIREKYKTSLRGELSPKITFIEAY
jgi:L-asparaginase